MMQFAITKIKIISTYHWLLEKCSNDKCRLSCKFLKVSLNDFVLQKVLLALVFMLAIYEHNYCLWLARSLLKHTTVIEVHV